MKAEVRELVSWVNAAVCMQFGVSEEGLYAHDTSKQVSAARWFAWTLLHDVFGLSGSTLAREFGRTERAIWNAVSLTRARMAHQKEFAEAFEQLARLLLSGRRETDSL